SSRRRPKPPPGLWSPSCADIVDLCEDHLPATVALCPDIDEPSAHHEWAAVIDPLGIDDSSEHGAVRPDFAHLLADGDVRGLASRCHGIGDVLRLGLILPVG